MAQSPDFKLENLETLKNESYFVLIWCQGMTLKFAFNLELLCFKGAEQIFNGVKKI